MRASQEHLEIEKLSIDVLWVLVSMIETSHIFTKVEDLLWYTMNIT